MFSSFTSLFYIFLVSYSRKLFLVYAFSTGRIAKVNGTSQPQKKSKICTQLRASPGSPMGRKFVAVRFVVGSNFSIAPFAVSYTEIDLKLLMLDYLR